jgi:WD40 repeat protein
MRNHYVAIGSAVSTLLTIVLLVVYNCPNAYSVYHNSRDGNNPPEPAVKLEEKFPPPATTVLTVKEIKEITSRNTIEPVPSVGDEISFVVIDEADNTVIQQWKYVPLSLDIDRSKELEPIILGGKRVRPRIRLADFITDPSMAFSPDWRRIVTRSEDYTLKVWDMDMGREPRSLPGRGNLVISIAFSPDGRRIVSGAGDKTIMVWDAETGEELKGFEEHSNAVLSAAFSPDGRRIVSGSRDKTIKVWDIETGKELKSFEGHSDAVLSAAFSPDGRYIVSGSDDKTLKVWDAETGEELKSFEGHSERVRSVAFSPDGRRIVSGSGDKTIKIWDVETGEELKSFEGRSDTVFSIAFSPDWYSGVVLSVAFSPDGRYIVSGANDNTLKVWDVETGKEIHSISGHSASVKSVGFSPDGRRIVSGSSKTIKVWDAETGEEIVQILGLTDGEWLCVTPEGYYNASPGGEQYLKDRAGNEISGMEQYR